MCPAHTVVCSERGVYISNDAFMRRICGETSQWQFRVDFYRFVLSAAGFRFVSDIDFCFPFEAPAPLWVTRVLHLASCRGWWGHAGGLRHASVSPILKCSMRPHARTRAHTKGNAQSAPLKLQPLSRDTVSVILSYRDLQSSAVQEPLLQTDNHGELVHY